MRSEFPFDIKFPDWTDWSDSDYDDDDDDDDNDDDDNDDDDYLLALNFQIVGIDQLDLIGKVGSSQINIWN